MKTASVVDSSGGWKCELELIRKSVIQKWKRCHQGGGHMLKSKLRAEMQREMLTKPQHLKEMVAFSYFINIQAG